MDAQTKDQSPDHSLAVWRVRQALLALSHITLSRANDEERCSVNATGLAMLFEILSDELEKTLN